MNLIKVPIQRAFRALGYTVMRTSSYAALCSRDSAPEKPSGGDLTAFKDWWLATRPINVPWDDALHFDGRVTCVTLYRAGCWQVQEFVVQPDTVINQHVHPDVDSYECYLYGDITFTNNGKEVITGGLARGANFSGQPRYFLATIRVLPSDVHGGVFGPRGGVFLSFQKWPPGTTPTNIGSNWASERKLRSERI